MSLDRLTCTEEHFKRRPIQKQLTCPEHLLCTTPFHTHVLQPSNNLMRVLPTLMVARKPRPLELSDGLRPTGSKCQTQDTGSRVSKIEIWKTTPKFLDLLLGTTCNP